MAGFDLSFNLSGMQESETAKTEPGELVERDVVIIGSGPAGLTAAIYTARAQRNPLVLAGQTYGGQMALTSAVENFPGFSEGVGGMELVDRMTEQARKFGAEVLYSDVIEVDASTYPFTIKTLEITYQARALVISTGTSPRKIGVPGEDKFFGRGVSTCATCDGFFYQDRTVVVVGGGDSAMDESLYLTRFAKEVIVVHRRDKLRASAILQERAFANEKIRIIWDSVVNEIEGDRVVTGVRLRNVKTGEISELPCDGVFIYAGLIPNSQLFAGQVEINPEGYILTDRYCRTNIPGVFAAGDIQDPYFRQIVVAAGSGAAAAIEAEHFLAEKDYELAKTV